WNISAVRARFILGPAGSGKTFRCLEEVRGELASDETLPLLFLAPKQATFQLERQLLSDKNLEGYTRLQILSFDRLAEFILEIFQKAPATVLSDQGRLMILRALLLQNKDRLQLFHSTARLPGFAQQLNSVLRELQQSQVAP